jgi:hypothetical protein
MNNIFNFFEKQICNFTFNSASNSAKLIVGEKSRRELQGRKHANFGLGIISFMSNYATNTDISIGFT